MQTNLAMAKDRLHFLGECEVWLQQLSLVASSIRLSRCFCFSFGALSNFQNYLIIFFLLSVIVLKILFLIYVKPIDDIADLMLAEHTKIERARVASVQALTDKMSRMTHRKPQNPKLLLNELTTGDKTVTFRSNNHSTTKATSSEGKKRLSSDISLLTWCRWIGFGITL